MRALRVDLVPHRAAVALTVGRFRPQVRRGGRGSMLHLVEAPAPERPPGWVRVRPLLAGICASDHKFLTPTGWGTTLMALYGLPRRIILGHEVVGVVTEADPAGGPGEGDRLVLEPTLSCHDKGFDLCARCRDGDEQACERFGDPSPLGPGHGFGHQARFGGGWAEELVAPARHAFRVPEGLDDRSAVLAEPFAVAVHAVARNLPRPADRVLVIGPGTVGLAIVHALRALVPGAEVTVAGLGHFADEFATRAGAHALLHRDGRGLVETAADALAAGVWGNRLSGPVLDRGYDVVFDVVGSPQTLDDALRVARSRGTVVLVGTGLRQRVDWSLVWARELRLVGTAYYGVERIGAAGHAQRSIELALDILGDARPSHMVTHVFPLEQAVAALTTSAEGPAAGAVRVAFAPGDRSPPAAAKARP